MSPVLHICSWRILLALGVFDLWVLGDASMAHQLWWSRALSHHQPEPPCPGVVQTQKSTFVGRWNGSDLDNSLFWIWALSYKKPWAGTCYENSIEKQCCCYVWVFPLLKQMLLLAGQPAWSNALTECDKAGELWYQLHFQSCVCSAVSTKGSWSLGRPCHVKTMSVKSTNPFMFQWFPSHASSL